MLRVRSLFMFILLVVLFMIVLILYNTYYLNLLFYTPKKSKTMPKELNGEHVDSRDSKVIDFLKEQCLLEPSTLPYNLTNPFDINPSMGQAQTIDKILKAKQNGFFIECGALDGEIRSNTLFFERFRGWSGLLIEADPKNYEQMVMKRRKAYLSQSCLAPTTYPDTVLFEQQENQGHIKGRQSYAMGGVPVTGIIEVQCFPFYSFMDALQIFTVDYFSLDVEGAEYSVLTSIPWEKIDIKTLSVEFIHDAEGKEAICKFMEEKGYIVHSLVLDPHWLANDFIFVKKDLVP